MQPFRFADDQGKLNEKGKTSFRWIPNGIPGVETRLIAEGEARRVTHCFATLEPDRAEAVRGAYLDGLSYQDLADRYAVPINTMRTWLRRSLLRLKECMEA